MFSSTNAASCPTPLGVPSTPVDFIIQQKGASDPTPGDFTVVNGNQLELPEERFARMYKRSGILQVEEKEE